MKCFKGVPSSKLILVSILLSWVLCLVSTALQCQKQYLMTLFAPRLSKLYHAGPCTTIAQGWESSPGTQLSPVVLSLEFLKTASHGWNLSGRKLQDERLWGSCFAWECEIHIVAHRQVCLQGWLSQMLSPSYWALRIPGDAFRTSNKTFKALDASRWDLFFLFLRQIDYHQRKISKELKMFELSRIMSTWLWEETIESTILLKVFCRKGCIQVFFSPSELEVGKRIWIYLVTEKKSRGKKNTFYLVHRLWYENFVGLFFPLTELPWWGMKETFLLMSSDFLALCFARIPDPLLFLPTHLQSVHGYSYFIAADPQGPIIVSQSWQRWNLKAVYSSYICLFIMTGSLQLYRDVAAQKLWFLLKKEDLQKFTSCHVCKS